MPLSHTFSGSPAGQIERLPRTLNGVGSQRPAGTHVLLRVNVPFSGGPAYLELDKLLMKTPLSRLNHDPIEESEC
jgi:hypothetical protein